MAEYASFAYNATEAEKKVMDLLQRYLWQTTNFTADYHAFSLMYLGRVISTMIIAVSLGIFPNFFLEFGNNQRRVSPKDLWQDLYYLMYDVTL